MKNREIVFESCEEPWQAIDITEKVQDSLEETDNGFVLVYTTHTSTSLMIGKNTKELLEDYTRAAQNLLTLGRPYRHSQHGHQSGEQHAFCFISGFEVLVPICNGKLMLGEEQRIFFFESTGGKRPRTIWLFNVKGECIA